MESYQFDNVEEARKCLGFPKGESFSKEEAKRLYVLKLRANNPDRVLGQDPKRKKEATQACPVLHSAILQTRHRVPESMDTQENAWHHSLTYSPTH